MEKIKNSKRKLMKKVRRMMRVVIVMMVKEKINKKEKTI